MENESEKIVKRERIDVEIIFMMKGYILGGWEKKIKEFEESIGIDREGMGMMIMVWGIG